MAHQDFYLSRFIERMFVLLPRSKELHVRFGSDLPHQQRPIFRAVDFVVSQLPDVSNVGTYLRKLGQRHPHYKPYSELFRRTLLYVLEQSVRGSFTPDLSMTWSIIISFILETIADGVIQTSNSEDGEFEAAVFLQTDIRAVRRRSVTDSDVLRTFDPVHAITDYGIANRNIDLPRPRKLSVSHSVDGIPLISQG
eukprot:CAMPEP_0184670036 /NCGR_PEP_ID=MMETSP0308-20130426/80284_1 /TAXON_ID=38269 /ORGANISM="Gloeochaete witrockiana, Strain SAG 46.84" /LENGTH=194 /DNA_ID=CAMNT_0027116593 /DNA_START=250 /DNA_END=834 /DNA_ORIENTATION=-